MKEELTMGRGERSRSRAARPVLALLWLLMWPWGILGRGEQLPVTSGVVLKGHSSGGVLTLAKTSGRPLQSYVLVTNRPGDDAATVLQRLARGVAASAAQFGGNPLSRLTNDLLVFFGPNPWILGGTEAGFGIPAPVTALSAEYQRDRIVIRWINPPVPYDRVEVVFNGARSDAPLPGDATEYTQPLEPHRSEE